MFKNVVIAYDIYREIDIKMREALSFIVKNKRFVHVIIILFLLLDTS